MVVGLYAVYSVVRSLAAGDADDAFGNALWVMDVQDTLGMNHELAWQQWALGSEPLVVTANYFYGSAYALVTLGTLVWLYRRHIDDYPRWRTTVIVGTLVALIGFATFPLMPPRLLDAHDVVGQWGFVDTMATFPTLWSFQSGAMASISNPFAAMPSLHCGWAMWVCAAVWPHLRSWWWRTAAVGYVVATVVVVVITGNHFFLDAVGGAVVMGIGFAVATVTERRPQRSGESERISTARR
jgi:hypothetical protein